MAMYDKLRCALLEAGYTGEEAAQRILIARPTFSSKLNGRTAWTLDEMYALVDLIGCGAAAIPTLFPDRRGKKCG